jgi:hypothetical protein
MNYYPADNGWTLMWTHYSHARTVSDFKAIAALNANTVRIIVQPDIFGYPRVSPVMKSRFDDVLAVARAQRLSVQLTLFDLWGNYDQIKASEVWLDRLLAGDNHDPAIALVELRNELPVASPAALHWALALLPDLARVLPGVPRTVSVAGAGAGEITREFAALPGRDLDVVDVHFYGPPVALPPLLSAVRTVAAGRPVIVGEVGRSTLPAAGMDVDAEQADYFSTIARLVAAAGLPPFAPWIFSDFAPGAIPRAAGEASKLQEYHLGLRRLDGSWKPAAAVVRSMFQA